MYINTFKYTPKDVSCQLCTEYVKKLGCTALRCPWLAERIEAGVVGYREAVLETFPHERRLFQRLNLLIKHYPGSLWSNEQHERRMQYQCAVQGYRRRRDTNAYYAAMYLLTSNDDIYRRTANCFCKDGIEFGYQLITALRVRSSNRRNQNAILLDTVCGLHHGFVILDFEWMPFERVQFRQRDFYYFFSLSIGMALLRRKQIIYRCQFYFFRAAFQVSTPPSSDFDTPLPPYRQGHGRKCFFPLR